MNSSDFYIDLSSNVDDNGFSEKNTISNFVTELHSRYNLEGNWEVGLCEISYSKSWYNLQSDSHITLFDEIGYKYFPTRSVDVSTPFNGEYGDPREIQRTGIVKKGYYNSAEELVNVINKELSAFPEVEVLPHLRYNNISKCITVVSGSNETKETPRITESKNVIPLTPGKKIYPSFSLELENILGLQTYEGRTIKSMLFQNPGVKKSHEAYLLGKYNGFRTVQMNAGIHTLFIYCDIVYPQYVGNSFTKLLRAVKVPNEVHFGDQIVIMYDNIHYLPLQYKEFQSIQISIKDDSDSPINFRSGRSRVKLHFRKNVR
jgi:hypothetical protein